MDSDEELDPRIQVELESLNVAGQKINRMSSELDEARSKFRSMLNDSTQKLNSMLRRNRKSIERARPFYEAKIHAKQVQTEAQQSAIQYQRATIEYKAAKETIELAEQRFLTCSEEEKREFDSAWQEMLNHATMKVMKSEKEKAHSEQVHLQMAAAFQAAEESVHQLARKHRRSVSKSRPFFDLKSQLEIKLQQQKQNVEDLQKTVKSSHVAYSEALKNLEQISEDIHTRRKSRILLLSPREPGVGAESDLPPSEIDFDSLNRCHSSMSSFPSDLSEDDRNLEQSTETDVFSQSEESGVFSIDSFDNDSLGKRDSLQRPFTCSHDSVKDGNNCEPNACIADNSCKLVLCDSDDDASMNHKMLKLSVTEAVYVNTGCNTSQETLVDGSCHGDGFINYEQVTPSSSTDCFKGKNGWSSEDENSFSTGNSSDCEDGDDEDDDIFNEFQKRENPAGACGQVS